MGARGRSKGCSYKEISDLRLKLRPVALSPTLTPLLAQRFGWDSALYVAAILALLGAFFWLWIHPERAIDLGEEAAALPQETLVVEGKPRV